MDALTEERVREALAGLDVGPFGAEARVFAQIGSTNDVARELAEGGVPEGTLVLADEQTAGRGRFGREWVAPPGSSLLMSVVFRPAIPLERANRLVMLCGLALAEACEALADVRVVVKWPNDAQIDGKKVAGILAESAVTGAELAWAVVGVGVNVNQVFAPGDPLAETATSLRMSAGREFDRLALLGALLERLNGWRAHLLDEKLTVSWRTRCATLGQRVRVEAGARTFEGLAEDLDADGALLLRDADGARHRLTAGEATLLAG